MSTVVVPNRWYDLLIIGLGPAGVSCALQAYREGLDIVAVSDEPVGGLVRAAFCLSNLAGTANLSGHAFAAAMETQLAALEIPVCFERVVSLIRSPPGFEARLNDQQLVRASTVCLATGTRPARWSLGETLVGVHRDARSLPADLAGSVVAIIGGGEAAIDTALSITERGGQPRIVARSLQLKAAPILITQLLKLGIEVYGGMAITQVTGGPGDWVLSGATGSTITAHELVVCIGRVPADELGHGLLNDHAKFSVTNTGVYGLMLAGDVLRGRDRYIALAIADGQQAAIRATRYLHEAI